MVISQPLSPTQVVPGRKGGLFLLAKESHWEWFGVSSAASRLDPSDLQILSNEEDCRREVPVLFLCSPRLQDQAVILGR